MLVVDFCSDVRNHRLFLLLVVLGRTWSMGFYFIPLCMKLVTQLLLYVNEVISRLHDLELSNTKLHLFLLGQDENRWLIRQRNLFETFYKVASIAPTIKWGINSCLHYKGKQHPSPPKKNKEVKSYNIYALTTIQYSLL